MPWAGSGRGNDILGCKKAFVSVDHGYIERTLKQYNFGPAFTNCFKTLYKGTKARILINRYLSQAIDILRGVKQGDALRCAIFILCIDPLLRNINNDSLIEKVKIETKITSLNHLPLTWKIGSGLTHASSPLMNSGQIESSSSWQFSNRVQAPPNG